MVTTAPVVEGAPVVTMPVVALDEVTKTFGTTTVIDELTLAVEAGQIFGMIGPSGCGKTTIIRLLLGVLAPTSGTVEVMGSEPRHLTAEQRSEIGYTPQGFFLYPTLTASENLHFVAGLFGMPFWGRRRRIREVLEFLELWDARNRLARDLSGGMQRRLELACALVHRPSILFVDEPTSGLDPMLREKIWEYLRRLRDQGTSVVVTTQFIDEAQYCDTVAILSAGKILAVGPPDTLRQRAMGGDIVNVDAEAVGREDLAALRQLPGVQFLRWTDQGILRLVVDEAATATPLIIQELQGRGVHVVAVEPYEPTFDEVFMRIVNSHAR
jgi:ABC-2 type transport system ATP-binding protein